jgi:hypothetical protein
MILEVAAGIVLGELVLGIGAIGFVFILAVIATAAGIKCK